MIKCPICHSEAWKLISKDLYTEDNLYLRCKECGSAFCEKDTSRLDNYYNEFYESEGSLENSKYFRHESRRILRYTKWYLKQHGRFKNSGKLLDIGAGRGEFLYIAKQTGRYECVGLDISAKSAEYAKQLFGLDLIVSEFKAELFEGEKFDVIYMRHLIEHIQDPNKLLADVKAICKPGAMVVVHLPNDLCFTNSFKRFLYRLGISTECGALIFPYHLVGYNPYSLKLLFEKAGFRHLKTRTYSKLNPHNFHYMLTDIALLPFSLLDTLPGRGHVIISYFTPEMLD